MSVGQRKENIYQIQKVGEDIWYVNEGGLDAVYLVRGQNRGLIIDTGTGVKNLRELAEKYMKVPYDVVLTHGHVDHAGGISQFETVFINSKDRKMADEITVADRKAYAASMNAVGASQVKVMDFDTKLMTDRKPNYISIEEGYVFDLGDRQLKVSVCPGHTSGSLCLINREEGLIFSGDSMNDVELLCAQSEDRKKLLQIWCKKVSGILEEGKKADVCYGGHSVFNVEKAWEILECGRKLLNSEIKLEKRKIHIFTGNFAQYKNSYLTVDESLEKI